MAARTRLEVTVREEDWEKELRELLELEPEEVQAQIQFDARHENNEHDAEESVVTEKLDKNRLDKISPKLPREEYESSLRSCATCSGQDRRKCCSKDAAARTYEYRSQGFPKDGVGGRPLLVAKSEVPVVKDLQGNAPGPGDGSKVAAPGSWKDRPGRGSIPTLGLSRNPSGTRKAGLETPKCTRTKCTQWSELVKVHSDREVKCTLGGFG